MDRFVRATPLVLTLVLLVIISTGVSPPPVPTAHADGDDRAALIALYHATDGANWRDNTNWLSDKPLNEWAGVRSISSDNGRVSGLYLERYDLTGQIPPELGNLAKLKLLDLGDNQLTGPIPPELGDLANLGILSLYGN